MSYILKQTSSFYDLFFTFFYKSYPASSYLSQKSVPWKMQSECLKGPNDSFSLKGHLLYLLKVKNKQIPKIFKTITDVRKTCDQTCLTESQLLFQLVHANMSLMN